MTDWMESAACAHPSVSPEWFFPTSPIGRTDTGGDIAARARQACGGCPVRNQCLTYAQRDDRLWGVWGGKTYEERHHRRQI